jgi:histone acetyltransferase 1
MKNQDLPTKKLKFSDPDPVPQTSAIEAIEMRLISSTKDLESPGFPPSFAVSIFGQEELILGYTDPKVIIYINSSTLEHCFSISYSRYDPSYPSLEQELTSEVFTEEFSTDVPLFNCHLEAPFTIPGICLSRYTLKSQQYEIHKADFNTPGFLELHKYLKTLPVWFIDGGSIVDSTEPFWEYFLLYNTSKPKPVFVGMCSCYLFYSKLDSCRARLSQFMILPPYQRSGHGSYLLKAVYAEYRADSKIKEITVEDCSEDMQALRDVTDFADVYRCLKEKLIPPYPEISSQLIKETAQELKLFENQVHRCVELYKYECVLNDEKYEDTFRKEIKKRLYLMNYDDLRPDPNLPSYKHIYIRNLYLDDDSDSESIKQQLKLINWEDAPSWLGMKPASREYIQPEERKERLSDMYECLLEEYEKVISKVMDLSSSII